MPFFFVLCVVGAGIGLYFFSEKAKAMSEEQDTSLDSIFQKYGAQYGVEWQLLKAIAMTESDLDPNAENPSDPSYGLMQILCHNDDGGPCTNTFNVEDWDGATPQRLKDPDYNVRIGAQILAFNIRTYGLPRGIAVYNSYDQRFALQDGPFKNQAYVDKVVGFYKELTA